MKPIDPAIGIVVIQAWADYQVVADRERIECLRAMTESDAATGLLALFRGPLPPPPTTAQTSTGMVEMRRVLDARAR